nr:ATP-binding cassette domain-containing protein [Fodinicola feengrottensis]
MAPFRHHSREHRLRRRPHANPREFRAAVEAAQVDTFVHGLPDGYDTVVGEAAGRLSAGQRQLIAIARAFITEPALLILDEATNALDSGTELAVVRAMAVLRWRCTSLVIAHRLSTARIADIVVVMSQGRIVEQGTHDDLLARGGLYTKLYDAHKAVRA